MSGFVYRTFDADGVLLYVGFSNNWQTRLAAHRRCSLWWDEMDTAAIQRYSSAEEGLAAEAFAIRTENPKYNIAGLESPERKARQAARAIPEEPVAPAKPQDRLLQFGTAAERMGMTEDAFRKRLERGQLSIEVIPLGNSKRPSLRVRESDVEALIERVSS